MTDETTRPSTAETATDPDGLVQFFQHAHHRVEGWLIDFDEELNEGRIAHDAFGLAVAGLRQHMFAEEEHVFPLLRPRLADHIAGLEEAHGRIADLIDEVTALIERNVDHAELRRALATLEGILAAHNGEEDFGIYPDLVALLGVSKSRALLAEVEQAEPPTGWVPAARQASSRP